MTTTRPIKYMVAVIGNMAEGIININHKAIIEAFIEVYFKVTAKRNTIFVRN